MLTFVLFLVNYAIKTEIIPDTIPELEYFNSVTITCRSQYIGKLRWLNSNGTEITSDKTSTVFQRYSSCETDFTIHGYFECAYLNLKKVTRNNGGMYYCLKIDPFGLKKQAVINISVKGTFPQENSDN